MAKRREETRGEERRGKGSGQAGPCQGSRFFYFKRREIMRFPTSYSSST
jgi:hypothetical protein